VHLTSRRPDLGYGLALVLTAVIRSRG
jgi:hypothetical protein